MDDIYCHGCDDYHPDVRDYVVMDHDGVTHAPVPYCAECADLARIDWNGETAAIVEVGAEFKASDNPEVYTAWDVADLGNPHFASALFTLDVGAGRYYHAAGVGYVERVR